MSTTLKEIARRVGRSVTTVSRALAGYDDVSEATREQVRQVALELGYEPNIIARQLQKQRTDTIGLILPTFGEVAIPQDIMLILGQKPWITMCMIGCRPMEE